MKSIWELLWAREKIPAGRLNRALDPAHSKSKYRAMPANQSTQHSIEHLQSLVKSFCQERDWDQFHPPKDLAIGISTEANELLDLFRFKSEQEIQKKLSDASFKQKVEHELADVFFFVLRFAQMNSIDLSSALKAKLDLNASKYPVETAKGSNKKYSE